jgi:integrase/recombinase XerD
MTHALPVLWRQYVTELRVNRKLEPKSIKTYEVGWGSLMATARLMGWRLRTTEDITHERIVEWQGALMDESKKPTTCDAHMNAVRGFTRWANIHGHAKTDAGARFKSARLKRILPVLPPFEVMEAKLSAEPSLRNRVILSIGLYGLRAEEITNLRRSNFVPDAGLMGFIGKGSKQRSVALPEKARAVIRQYLAATVGQPQDPLIRKEDGSRAAVTYMIVYRSVLRWTQRHLGVRLTPHKLRHAYGKNCVDLGADIRVISEALGHESLDSTRIYTQVSCERTRALAALFDSPGGKIIPVDSAKKVRKMH